MAKPQSRRNFLRSAPLAAAARFSLPEPSFGQAAAPVPFQLFTAPKLADAMKELQATPGNTTLFESTSLPFNIVLTTETAKSAKEFEWHEERDHIFQVLEGATIYEIGGTPQGARNTRPGEWVAPSVQVAATLTLNKGDMLVIPRNTPHRRSTANSVTFYLISTAGK